MGTEILGRAKVGRKTILTIAYEKEKGNPNQIELFGKRRCAPEDRESWFRGTLEVAMTMRAPFFMSDLRNRCAIEPFEQNSWGKLTQCKEWRATFRQTGEYRKSPIKSRKGGVEAQWERK